MIIRGFSHIFRKIFLFFVIYSQISLTIQGILYRHFYFYIITPEYFFHFFFFKLRSKPAYHRNNNQSCYHSNCSCIDAGIKYRINHIFNCNSKTGYKTCPYCCPGRLFPIKPIKKRCQKCSCKCAPGHTHKLCYKRRWI